MPPSSAPNESGDGVHHDREQRGGNHDHQHGAGLAGARQPAQLLAEDAGGAGALQAGGDDEQRQDGDDG